MAKKQTKTGKTFTKLTRLQTVQLFNWLEAHPVQAKGQTSGQLAPLITTELGFPVSKSSVEALRKEMGIEVEVVREPKRKVTWASVRVIAREMVNLLKKFNEPVSAELEEMAK